MEALGAEAARRFRPLVKSDDVCLDFGCGGGRILEFLEVGHRIGVEPSEVSQRRRAGGGSRYTRRSRMSGPRQWTSLSQITLWNTAGVHFKSWRT